MNTFTVIDNNMFPTHYGDISGVSIEEINDSLFSLMKTHNIEFFSYNIKSDGLSNVIFVKPLKSGLVKVLRTPISERYCEIGDIATLDIDLKSIRCSGACFEFNDKWEVESI